MERTEYRDRHEAKNPRRDGSPETGCPTPPYRKTLRPRRDETLACRKVRGEAPANKAGAGAEESKLWREEPHEGIDGRRRLALATARIRCGNNALKTIVSEQPERVARGRFDRADECTANVKRARSFERRTDRDGENALKG
jgi:hypothetical protein